MIKKKETSYYVCVTLLGQRCRFMKETWSMKMTVECLQIIIIFTLRTNIVLSVRNLPLYILVLTFKVTVKVYS